MVPELRRAYNAAFTPERYQAMVQDLEAQAGFPIEFRICETPLFLSAETARELERAAFEIAQAATSPGYLSRADRAVPPELNVPGEDAHTTFLQVDFALTRSAGGELLPQLIELQGFPTVYGFQWMLDQAYRRHFDIREGLTPYFSGLDPDSYAACLREAIVGDCDPETVILLEIEPEKQKTRVDFAATERMLGIATVGTEEVVERGGKLFYRRGGRKPGREVPIRRIYNRVIFDEMHRKGLSLDPLFRRELDVEWVGHPNWYLKISKFTLPFLESRYAPPAWFLSELPEIPDDLENYVLKPLFSFAGLGVELAPSRDRLQSIENPEDFLLQRRVDYAPVVDTPDEPAKVEVRMMFVWQDELRLINNLVRMSKGRMMGVDFNKDKTWIGASLAYHPA